MANSNVSYYLTNCKRGFSIKDIREGHGHDFGQILFLFLLLFTMLWQWIYTNQPTIECQKYNYEQDTELTDELTDLCRRL